jgi:hypothetical protein
MDRGVVRENVFGTSFAFDLLLSKVAPSVFENRHNAGE